jgi:hypothetical protein
VEAKVEKKEEKKEEKHEEDDGWIIVPPKKGKIGKNK